MGKLPPAMVKPVPVMEAELTVTGEVPVEVRVIVWVAGEFTVTLPKLRFVALTDNCGLRAADPVPLRATTAVLPVVELLVMLTWPVSDPVAVGLNCTCKVVVWLGFRVTGTVPAMVKPVPVMEAELTVTGEVPVEVRVMV